MTFFLWTRVQKFHLRDFLSKIWQIIYYISKNDELYIKWEFLYRFQKWSQYHCRQQLVSAWNINRNSSDIEPLSTQTLLVGFNKFTTFVLAILHDAFVSKLLSVGARTANFLLWLWTSFRPCYARALGGVLEFRCFLWGHCSCYITHFSRLRNKPATRHLKVMLKALHLNIQYWRKRIFLKKFPNKQISYSMGAFGFPRLLQIIFDRSWPLWSTFKTHTTAKRSAQPDSPPSNPKNGGNKRKKWC